MTIQTYTVAGMSCGHCVHAVTEELQTLAGVSDIAYGCACFWVVAEKIVNVLG